MSSRRTSDRIKMAGGSKAGQEKKRKTTAEEVDVSEDTASSTEQDSPNSKKRSKTILSPNKKRKVLEPIQERQKGIHIGSPKEKKRSVPEIKGKGKGKAIYISDSDSETSSGSYGVFSVSKRKKSDASESTSKGDRKEQTKGLSSMEKKIFVKKKLRHGRKALEGLTFLFNSVIKIISSLIEEIDVIQRGDDQAEDEAESDDEEEGDNQDEDDAPNP